MPTRKRQGSHGTMVPWYHCTMVPLPGLGTVIFVTVSPVRFFQLALAIMCEQPEQHVTTLFETPAPIPVDVKFKGRRVQTSFLKV